MKTVFVYSLVILTPLLSAAQNHVYVYTPGKEGVALYSENSNIKIGRFEKNKEGIVQKTVNANGSIYKVSIKKTKAGKVQEFTDPTGQLLATIPLNKLDITLADGTTLKWNGMSNKKWSYSKEGKEVLRGSLSKINGQKVIAISTEDLTLPLDLIHVAAAERGIAKIDAARNTGVTIGIASAVALFQLAVTSSQQDDGF
jgi:hypothetical protein